MFFEEIDSLRILERNSNKIEALELREARRLARLYRKAREDIKLRLLSSSSNTFTEARLNTTLEQIDKMLVSLNTKIKQDAQLSFEDITEQGFEDSAREINKFEKHFNGVTSMVDVDTIIESLDSKNYLFNQYESSLESYSNYLRTSFQSTLTQSLIQKKTWTQAVSDMEMIFNGGEWRLARIVRTELHNIYNHSKMQGFEKIQQDYIPDMKKTLYHPMDSRTGGDSEAMAKQNLIVDINEPFVFKYNGKTYNFMFPPNRPNDRAILIPYRESYDK